MGDHAASLAAIIWEVVEQRVRWFFFEVVGGRLVGRVLLCERQVDGANRRSGNDADQMDAGIKEDCQKLRIVQGFSRWVAL